VFFKRKPPMDINNPVRRDPNHGNGGEPPRPIDPDETAALIEQLQSDLAKSSLELDEARAAHKQALADFQNYQRRALTNEQQAREQGVRGVLFGVINIVDHFEMALSLDPEKTTAKQVIGGVLMIKDELLQALQAQGMGVIKPAKNGDFDPTRHEAIMQQAAEGVQPGRVVATLRLGYTLNDRVIRPAQVSIAPK